MNIDVSHAKIFRKFWWAWKIGMKHPRVRRVAGQPFKKSCPHHTPGYPLPQAKHLRPFAAAGQIHRGATASPVPAAAWGQKNSYSPKTAAFPAINPSINRTPPRSFNERGGVF